MKLRILLFSFLTALSASLAQAQVAVGSVATGASLPINYSLSTLTGNVRYVATNGNDTSGTGSASAPYGSLAKAVSASVSGDSIVIRGGTYRQQANVVIPAGKTLKITAYPGEIPVFNGAQAVNAGWVTEGSFAYIPYTPQPVTDGSGMSFSSGEGLTGDGVGKYPDQAWVGSIQLRQVSLKSSLTTGTFWVDRTNKRLYMTSVDAAQGNIEVSQKAQFLTVNAANSTLSGFRVTRYSNGGGDYGVVIVGPTADNTLVQDLEISDASFILFMVYGSDTGDINKNTTLRRVTLTNGNWMGVSSDYTDYLTLDSVKVTNLNLFDEFQADPQSGGIKACRTWYTKILNSEFNNIHSHGVWFDQSNYDAQIANNLIKGITGINVFFEVSDNLLLINNYIQASTNGQAIRNAGSSGLKILNNTIVGGRDPLGIYVDAQSRDNCADPNTPSCGTWDDRDHVRVHPVTMDWIPRLDLLLNNIIAYPTGLQYCSSITTMCITAQNDLAYVPISTVIHKADPTRNIPQTYINGNVYANGTGKIANTEIGSYASHSAFATAMAGSPVGISGFETNGLTGNSYVNADGTQTATLASLDSQAAPIPTNSGINQYLPAGTRHYGAFLASQSSPTPTSTTTTTTTTMPTVTTTTILPSTTTTTLPPTSASQTLLTAQVPQYTSLNDGKMYEMGMRFIATVNGQITGIRFYKSASESGTHTGKIYSQSGTLLAQGTFSNETSSGWQTLNLSTPLKILANTEYTVSVNTGNKYYVDTVKGFASQISNGYLKSVVGNNGVFGPVGSKPTWSYNNSNYFRDVIFVPASP